ncbi:tetraacyldisaccharide 4'-kinase [Pseudoalteromonas luteoviolacea]|uniref:tetraacyldisaccharide 4'-kinase n=1 Tax=Pseudoalteromonas luteoviolacea TaxID=43657 RepID=UPI001B398AC9|nr:tetraacyldisaccharide 4'-kinase [Pseudoalteromonas luteoviolacea]MBQ4812590.1 tetraacyldisaccharide 4'-kinase [Pseudoalteromonas luteoviolacea]
MNKIEKSWYQPIGLLNIALLPLSALFWLVSNVRRGLFKLGIKSSYKAPVPVFIVGNIGIGGNGKTPFVLWLVPYLQSLGLKVAVISRGYGAKPPHTPYQVNEQSTASQAGDEPLLIFNRLGCDVVIGGDRKASIEYLIEHNEPDIIISDDGLQHYQLDRDIEVCIVDNERRFGNGFLLPAGPLRELPSRLKTVDLAVYNGSVKEDGYSLCTTGIYSVKTGEKLSDYSAKGVAISAIGNPSRFEKSLRANGIAITQTKHFADHHLYSEQDFEPYTNQPVFMTEKDAVKCQAFAKQNWYFLRVDAVPSDALVNKLHRLLEKKGIISHGI